MFPFQPATPRTADCEDDDSGGLHIRRLLAASEYPAGDTVGQQRLVVPAHVLVRVLARHEQLHVQPHHLLLDERQVGGTGNIIALY